jgi:uncharacterized protein with PhoU and TrkA domain
VNGVVGERGSEEPVFDILLQVSHYASIAVDLALYALAFQDVRAAREVLRIENIIDDDMSRIVAGTAVAIRSPNQADIAVGIVSLASALDKVSDAAGDLAGLVLRGIPIHKFVRASSVCCGEAVALVKVHRKPEHQPSLIDILLARRDGEYILSPSWSDVEEGDTIVVRGPIEELDELARSVGYSIYSQLSSGTPALVAAIAGDDLSSAMLHLKSLARLMLDLAFHSLLYGDLWAAREVLRLEEDADSLYYRAIAYAFAAGDPSAAEEMVSIATFLSSMELIADAASSIANLVVEGRVTEFLVETIEEAEEAYLKLEATSTLEGRKISDLDLESMGVMPVAVRSRDTAILPVPRDYTIRAGDILIIKYYKGEDDVSSRLEGLGFKIIPPEPPEEE